MKINLEIEPLEERIAPGLIGYVFDCDGGKDDGHHHTGGNDQHHHTGGNNQHHHTAH
jgi:hypothetical protein